MLTGMCRNWIYCTLLIGMQNDVTNTENIIEGTLKITNELPCDLAILILGICVKELKSRSERVFCTSMFITATVTVAKI